MKLQEAIDGLIGATNISVPGSVSGGTSGSFGSTLYAGSTVTFPGARTGIGGWSDLAIRDSDGVIGVPLSARRYKLNEEPVPMAELAAIGQAVVTAFDYVEDVGGGSSFGLIADDLEPLGLERLIRYDDEGNVQGLQDSKIVYAVLAYAQSLESRIAALESYGY